MSWEAWYTLGVITLIMIALVRNWAGPDTVMLGGLTLLMTGGLFSVDQLLPTPKQAIAGFANEGLLTIGVLFVVALGMSQTGAMDLIAKPLLGRPTKLREAQLRLMLPVAGLSAFLNNTPIVAMFMPVVTDWCKKTKFPAGKLFIPLGYASILGGTCTLIGTSGNIVVKGLITDAQAQGEFQNVHIGMFTIAAVGLPILIVGITYLLICSRWLLPKGRSRSMDQGEDAREYVVEMLVQLGSTIDGKTIEQAGLRHLPGAYLANVERDNQRLVAVGPEQILRGNDRLFFVGLVESVVDLQKIRGLISAAQDTSQTNDNQPHRCLVEAVVSLECPIIGMSIREGRFRSRYNAAVIAVHRGSERVMQKIGDIIVQPGDTLLLETHPNFVEQQRNKRDFFLTSTVKDSKPIRHDKAWIAILALLAMVALVTFTPMSLLHAALLAGGVLAITGCFTMSEARQSVDLRVLLALAAAIGVGKTLEQSGASTVLAQQIVHLAKPMGPYAILASIYLVTVIFNMLIGNIGAAVLIFPIAKALALGEGLNFMPIAIAIMMGASASYATASYPVNLMVMGSGGYKTSNFFKVGLPLNILIMIIVVTLAPRIWPLVG
ncbi:MAG: SLC13 family permease [Phycisphaeraceae bacterium]|nr:SLC13 family permease [Phycisphaeraceae bacterium]